MLYGNRVVSAKCRNGVSVKRALLTEKRRAAYESKINQLKILFPVDISL